MKNTVLRTCSRFSSKPLRSICILGGTLGLALFFSSCRLGNRVVKAADPTSMSGYYSSQPKSMTLCAFVSGKPAQCAAADLEMIPSSIQDVMTDPVYVAANTRTAKAYLLPNSLDTQAAFEMILDPTGKITAQPYLDPPATLWTDPACLSQIQIQKEGMIRRTSVPRQDSSGQFSLSGSVDFSLGVLTVLGNSCATNLAEMKSCYEDVSLCPGSTPQEQQTQRSSIRNFLDPYLSRGALALTDLPGLMALGWEVAYE